jgi:hypothetical protein
MAFTKGHFCEGIHPMSNFVGRRSSMPTMPGTMVLFDGTEDAVIRVSWTNC